MLAKWKTTLQLTSLALLIAHAAVVAAGWRPARLGGDGADRLPVAGGAGHPVDRLGIRQRGPQGALTPTA